MSELTTSIRRSLEHELDKLEMASFNEGFEAAINGLDEISNALHNFDGDTDRAEIIRWAAKELRGDNA